MLLYAIAMLRGYDTQIQTTIPSRREVDAGIRGVVVGSFHHVMRIRGATSPAPCNAALLSTETTKR